MGIFEKLSFKLYKFFRSYREPLTFKIEVGKAWWADDEDEDKDLIQIEVNPRSAYTVQHYCLLELSKEEAKRLYENLGKLL